MTSLLILCSEKETLQFSWTISNFVSICTSRLQVVLQEIFSSSCSFRPHTSTYAVKGHQEIENNFMDIYKGKPHPTRKRFSERSRVRDELPTLQLWPRRILPRLGPPRAAEDARWGLLAQQKLAHLACKDCVLQIKLKVKSFRVGLGLGEAVGVISGLPLAGCDHLGLPQWP